MVKSITVTVDDVELKGPFSKTFKQKDGSEKISEYNILSILSQGVEYSTTCAEKDVGIASGKTDTLTYKGTEIGKGTLLNMDIDTKQGARGDFHKIVSLSQGAGTASTVLTATGIRTTAKLGNQVPWGGEGKVTFNNGNSFQERDVSMEVSGLTQALIGTGNYTNKDGKLNVEALEGALNLALGIKRKVAKTLMESA